MSIITSFRAGLAFFTRIPVGSAPLPPTLSGVVAWLPAVGLLVGALAALTLLLAALLGLPAPKIAHCPLLLAPDGRRLSKRDGDQSLENLRAKYTAEEIVGRLAFAYGLQPEPAPRTPESLIPDFSWDKVPKQDICLPENLF